MEKSGLRNLLEECWAIAFHDRVENFENYMNAAGYVRAAETIACECFVRGFHYTQAECLTKLRYQLEYLHKEGSWDNTKF